MCIRDSAPVARADADVGAVDRRARAGGSPPRADRRLARLPASGGRRAVAAARVAEGLRLGIGPGTAPEREGVDAAARVRPGPGRARGVPPQGPELPARVVRPRDGALPGDGLPAVSYTH